MMQNVDKVWKETDSYAQIVCPTCGKPSIFYSKDLRIRDKCMNLDCPSRRRNLSQEVTEWTVHQDGR